MEQSGMPGPLKGVGFQLQVDRACRTAGSKRRHFQHLSKCHLVQNLIFFSIVDRLNSAPQNSQWHLL